MPRSNWAGLIHSSGPEDDNQSINNNSREKVLKDILSVVIENLLD